MANFFKSKKFTITFSGIVVVLLVNLFNVSEPAAKEITTAIIGILGAFNIGQGLGDGLSKGKTSNVPK
jgi:xanthosine utilization system XapX-like protein